MYFHNAVERSGTLRRTQDLGGDNLSFPRQFLDGHRNMLVLINFLKGFDVPRTRVHHDKLYIWHAILLIEMRFELRYYYAIFSLCTTISPTHSCWRTPSPLDSFPSARVLPGANPPSRSRVRNRVRGAIHMLAAGFPPDSG